MRAIRWLVAVCCAFIIAAAAAPLLWLYASVTGGLHFTAGDRLLLLNSLLVATATAAAAIATGLPVAFLLRSARGPARLLAAGFAGAPLIIPPFIAAVAWIEILNRGGAPPFTAHGLLATLPLSENAVALIESTWVLTLCFFPCVTWPAFFALMKRSRDLEDDARLVGGDSAVTRHLSMPFLAAPAMAGALAVFFYHSLSSG